MQSSRNDRGSEGRFNGWRRKRVDGEFHRESKSVGKDESMKLVMIGRIYVHIDGLALGVSRAGK